MGYSETSGGTVVTAGSSDSLVVLNSFTPGGQGVYNIEFDLLNDFVDDVPSNNQMSNYSFEIGDYIYARDKGTPDGSIAPFTDFEVGNLFDIVQDQALTAVEVVFGAGLDENGIGTFARVYEIDNTNGDFVLLAESDIYNTQIGDAGALKTFSFSNPPLLQANNTYLVSVGSFSTGMSIATSGESRIGTSFAYGDLGGSGIQWYYIENTPMVRMSFDPCSFAFNEINLDITNAYCQGVCDGIVQDNETNLSLYEYNWYDSDNNLLYTGDQLTSACAGDYYVTKDDECGNSDQVNFTIEENPVVLAHNFNNLPASGCTSSDGEINLTVDVSSMYSSNDITIDVSGPTNETINTVQSATYTISNLLPGNYTVTITDNENGCTPWTYNTTVPYDIIEQSLCVVTVDSLNTDQNMVVWEKPSDLSEIDSFFVYREVTTSNYQKIGAVSVDSLSQFADSSANPNSTAYRYKISVLDVCGEETPLSPYHNTIHLQFQGNGNFNWNHYQIEGEANVVDSYNFYRDNQSDGNWQVIQVIPGNQNTFTDTDFNSYPDASYFVDVNWLGGNSTCQATKAQDYNSSRSNKYNTQADLSVASESDSYTNVIIRPNPVTNYLHVDNINQFSRIQILNSVGQIVYSGDENSNFEIDVSDLTVGVYILQITFNSEVVQKRFVKN